MPPSLLGPRVAAVYEMQSAWLEPRLQAKGITWTTFQLLTSVHSAGDEASQVEISRRLGVTPATLSETVQSHVKRGFLLQVPSTKDRRVKTLVLTSHSLAVMGEIKILVSECERVMAKGISAKDAENCAKVLDIMIQKLERQLE